MSKGYNLPFDYVLYRMSFANVRMYNAVIPSYSSNKEDKKEDRKAINGDDPANREQVRNAMFDVNNE